ncbi:MAG: class II aldolase/adducin family protein [Bdellovibrionaceae bacterium]|nr:class II aldolase/adducin family protein [Pseudobdellovibrionaceae bacterium]
MSDDSKSNLKKRIVKICKKLHKKNMLAAADGNISYRISDEEIWITPSGVMKAFMEPEDMACINIKGDILHGIPSSEMAMHLQVYKSSQEARAVIHAHPPYAIAWTISHPNLKELPIGAMSELILACGEVPIVPFALPGTKEMGDNLLPFLPKNKVMILARHGALCWGRDLSEAHRGIERLEHSAQILTLAHSLGGVTLLDEPKLLALKNIRQEIVKKMGDIVL